MKTNKVNTLIVGAGPAGLAAAAKLTASNRKPLLIEKENQVGGLAKTYIFKEDPNLSYYSDTSKQPLPLNTHLSRNNRQLTFLTDNGPHRFFSKNHALTRFLKNLLGEHWLEVPRQTCQFIEGKYYDYPIKPAQALSNIRKTKALKMLSDYLIAQLQYGLFKKPINNFEDYIIANFGKALGEFNMINYTEKIWGVPASSIHTDWAKQRIRGLSVPFLLKTAVQGFIKPLRINNLRTFTNVFYYPEYGTGLIYEKLKNQIQTQGCQLMLNTRPLKILHNQSKIKSVILKSEQGIIKVEIDNLIESVPINRFLQLLDPSPPPEVLSAADHLRYRDQVYLFVTLNKNRVSANQWIYFPEKDIPFGRISEMKNFSPKMSPPDKTSLFIEFFCFKGDKIWNMSKHNLLEITMSYLEPLGFCTKKEVRNAYLIKQENVYPIYDTDYQLYLKIIKDYLNQFTNLYYIGRPGRFRYNNQDHSLEMGFAAAQSILENKKYDLEKIGADSENLESHKLE